MPGPNFVPENERPGNEISTMDKGIWTWHNIARTDPRKLIPDLNEMK
jgi:hypothetical protein